MDTKEDLDIRWILDNPTEPDRKGTVFYYDDNGVYAKDEDGVVTKLSDIMRELFKK